MKGGAKGVGGKGVWKGAMPLQPPQGGVKRPATAPAQGLGQVKMAKAGEAEPAIIVFSTAEKDEIGIRTLVGEYKEEGANHGRKFYKKTQKIPGHEDINVYLYFWDERDGPAFSGWWFGNQVGGAQVWSRNRQATQVPPKMGWTIPWDGEVKRELVVMGYREKQMVDRKEAEMRQLQRRKEETQTGADQAPDANTNWDERLGQAAERAAIAQIDANEALDIAKVALEGDLDEEAVASGVEQLNAQNMALAETQRFFAQEGLAFAKADPQQKAELTALGQRVRKLQQQVKEELGKLRNAKHTKVKMQQDEVKRAEQESREQELEGQHSKQLEEMMPAAMEKVDVAEDEVEKVAIAAAPLQIDSADDLRPVMLQAIKETEQRVRAAQQAIGEGRRFITGKISQAQRFVPSAKRAAAEEFSALQAKLNAAQEKLNPYKTVRQDYEQRSQAKKLMEELSEKLAGAEIEVEKAAMMTAPLGGDSSEGIKETELALSAAQSALAQTSRLIESKLRGAEKTKGPVFDEVKTLQERSKIAQEKLDEVRKTVRETQVRIAADTLLKEVSEKVSIAEDELQKMAEAELPFLRGDQPTGKEIDELLAEADKVSAKVHSAIGEAQTFVARKLVEVARFSEGPARAVREEVDMLQKRLEEGRERLQQFRSGNGDRKRTHLLQEVEAKVTAAEGEVQKMTEATQALGSLGTAGDAVSEQLKEAVEQATAAERTAQASIVVARKQLLQKTAELKKLAISGAGSGSELGKLQTRVNTMQQEVAKLRNATKDAEEKIRVKQMLAEVAMRLQTAEAEAEKVAAIAAPLADGQPAPEAVERLEKAMASAMMKISATAKLVDVKLKSASGFLKEELAGMRSRLTQAEKKLNIVNSAAKEQKERLSAADLVAAANEKAEKAEAEVKKTGDAELFFLKGVEVVNAKEAAAAITDSEVAATGAQKAITEARTFVMHKLADAKQFTDGPADVCTKELLTIQHRLDKCAAQLAELKKDTAERKRKTQMQASTEKLAAVEASVQNLSNAMTKFADDRLVNISPEEARSVCEEIAHAEQGAQTAVSDARKYLALRVQEAKSFAEGQRASITAELGKLQARLTHCQVELAKLSKQCTEREQRFVAQKLLQEANTSFEKLRTEVEAAHKVAEPLLAEDTGAFLAGLYSESFASNLREYAKTSGQSGDAIFATFCKSKSASTEEFASFLNALPELAGKEELGFSGEQAAVILDKLGKGGKLPVASFSQLLKEYFICALNTTATDKPDGGQDLGTLAAGEGIELLEQKDGPEGSKMGKVILARDGATVWVNMTASTGAPNFKPSSGVGRLDSIEAYIISIHRACKHAAENADRKSVEVAGVKQGPLAEVKAKLLQLRTKIGQEQSKVEQLRKQVSVGKNGILEKRKDEVQKVQEVRIKAVAAKSVAEAGIAVEAAEKEAEKIIKSAIALGGAEKLAELDIAKLEKMKGAADKALEVLTDARGVVGRVSGSLEARRGPSRAALLEARVDLTKLGSRVSTSEKKVRNATEAVRTAHSQVVKTATEKARAALRGAARKSQKSSDELFDQGSGGKPEMSAEQFSKFVSTLKGHGLAPEQVSLVYKEFGPHGLRKSGFAKALQEFQRCMKGIAITDSFDIESGKTVRKMAQGETFEVLEGPKEDTETHMQRVRGRALRDGKVGWVSVASNQGTVFLTPIDKPFVWCASEAALRDGAGSASKQVRALAKDEVLELLEGPREETPDPELLVRCTASKDGAAGWITIRDATGTQAAQPSKGLYVCKSAIAMTDVFDIKNCQVVRKVDVGETLEVVGEAKEDSAVEISRLEFRAVRDGKKGWVTLKGNQGTVFVEGSTSHYTISAGVTLRTAASRDSVAVRELGVGEKIEATEAPREDQPDSRILARVRALEDSASGWLSWTKATKKTPLRPWTSKYVCKASMDITASLKADQSAVKKAEIGDVFECIQGPVLDASSGVRRVRVATAADGAVGWASVRDIDGAQLLEPSA